MKKHLLLFCFLLISSVVFGQQQNQPADLYRCGNGQTTVCFDLTQNDVLLLEGLNPSQYQITYHHTTADAQIGSNPILTTSQYCTTFSEQIYTRLLNLQDNTVAVANFGIYLVDTPPAPTQNLTVCGNETTGPICVNLASLIPNLSSGGAFNVTFYETQANADAGTNAIQNPNCYPVLTMLPVPLPLYYSIENPAAGCSSVGIVNVFVVECNSSCLTPSDMSGILTSSTSGILSWTTTNATYYEIYRGVVGSSSPNPNTNGTANATSSNYTFSNLGCNNTYLFYVRSVCNGIRSLWSNAVTITTGNCVGQLPNLTQCSDNSSACFNLTENDSPLLENLNPVEYLITYHFSYDDAVNGVNPISSSQAYCISNSQEQVFVRRLNLITNQAQAFFFMLIVQNLNPNVNSLLFEQAQLVECDNDNDGFATHNLTEIQAFLNDSGNLTFYLNYQDAVTQSNPISNPSAFAVSVQSGMSTVFVRQNVIGCDNIYNLPLITTPNCNLSSTCINAYSLCSALGAPFANTQNLYFNEPGADYGCLSSGLQPNPTWFYLPVSSPGTIRLKIEQCRNIDFVNFFSDVDYIVYGPFTSATTPCYDQLTNANIVSCSFSSNAVEFPIIMNAQAGQYYLIMTTNYSNQSGYIRISETTNSQGGINCSGVQVNAFLDANANGIKDIGEQNFPLGQFQIEKNNDGNVHNITAPTGVYNSYDENPTNSYNLGYTIDPAYSASYVLTTASYSNVSPVIGGGLQVYYFPITIVQSYNDIAVSIIPLGQPRAGFLYQNKVVYGNFGNQTIASGTVTFTKDDDLIITGNTQSGTTPSANGFSYNFTNLQPFEVRTIIVNMQVPPIPGVSLGQLLTNNATIIPLVGDVVPENNSSTLSEIVIGSYDPNDKMESHGDKILTSSFVSTDYLYYTIRFENTGTASAINVRINDLLDSKLDETSIKMVSASHDYILDRLDANLTWRFDNIQLPPSIENTSTGKGYVTFKVKPKAGYDTGDIIANTAGIYFDFNPVIVTNTFLTEFVATLAVNEFENSDFIFYPNPVQEVLNITLKNNANNIELIEVFDTVGKSMLHKKSATPSNSDSIDLTQLASGIYFIEVTTTNQLKVIKKVMRK